MWWLESRTATPSAASSRTNVDHGAGPGRIETAGRFVEQQQPRTAQQRRGEAESLTHPGRVAADPVVGATAETDSLQRGVDLPGARAPSVELGQQPQVGAPGQIRVEAGLLDEPADLLQHVAAEMIERATQQLDVPPSGRIRPNSIRSSVVLPAPLGPSSPRTSPGSMVRSSPSTAVVSPKRLTRFVARTACTAAIYPAQLAAGSAVTVRRLTDAIWARTQVSNTVAAGVDVIGWPPALRSRRHRPNPGGLAHTRPWGGNTP